MTPEEYLRGKNWKLHSAPGEWQTPCFACDDTNKRGHLYVNKEHGAYYCHRCGVSGSFRSLQKELGDLASDAGDSVFRREVWSKLVDIAQAQLLQNDEAISYLRRERGFTAKSIAKYRLGWIPGNVIDLLLAHFSFQEIKDAGLISDKNYPVFFDRILVPYFTRDRIVTLRGKMIGDNMIQARDTSVQLFGVDNLRGKQEVYICEGEFDAILLDQMGYPACAVPGALSWQDRWASWFDDARNVFVVMDSDEAGFKGAQKIKEGLGFKAKVVELPCPGSFKSTDVGEYFLRDGHTAAEFDALVDSFRDRKLFTVGEAWQERDDLLAIEGGVKTGFPQLDYAVDPGFLPGQVVVVLAKSGQGKTALIAQLVHNMSSWSSFDKKDSGEGIPTLLVSLEQTKAEFAYRLERMAKLFNPWATRADMGQWYANFRINDDNVVKPAQLERFIDEYVDEVGVRPKVLMVDYLGYWSRAFRGKSKYEQVSEAIMELKGLAKQQELVVFAPHQVNRIAKLGERFDMDVARDAGTVEETADFAFALYKLVTPDETDNVEMNYRTRAEVRLEFLKSRHGSVGKVVSLLWGPYSLSLSPTGSRWERDIETEWKAYDKGKTYEDVVDILAGRKYL